MLIDQHGTMRDASHPRTNGSFPMPKRCVVSSMALYSTAGATPNARAIVTVFTALTLLGDMSVESKHCRANETSYVLVMRAFGREGR